jgi:hypothetical protein
MLLFEFQILLLKNWNTFRFYKKIDKVAINPRIHKLLYLKIKMLNQSLYVNPNLRYRNINEQY